LDEAVAIARRAAVGARLAVTGQPHAHAVVDPGGNRHVELGAILDLTAAATVGARIGHHRAGALAGGASRLHAQDAGRLHDLSMAAAVAAGGPLRAGLAASPFARRAGLILGQLDGFHDAARRLFERERHIDANVRAASHATAAAAMAWHAEHLAEDIAEGLEDLLDVMKLMRELIGAGMA